MILNLRSLRLIDISIILINTIIEDKRFIIKI